MLTEFEIIFVEKINIIQRFINWLYYELYELYDFQDIQ